MEQAIQNAGRELYRWFGVAFGSMFLVVGICLIFAVIHRGVKQRSTSEWGEVQGRIIRVDGNRLYASPIEYQYTMDGKTYRSFQVCFVDHLNLKDEEWLAQAEGIPSEGPVTVYVNAHDHAESVLKTGPMWSAWNGLGFGIVFTGFSVCWIFLWWRQSNHLELFWPWQTRHSEE